MPLFYQHVNEFAKIAIWHIEEEKKFFSEKVPLQREITHPHKQLQHLAGRYLLQFLYPDFPYHLIEIADTRKPYLPNEEYHFSISHCGDYAAVIISKEKRVGIDIELFSTKAEKVKYKFLNEEEQKKIVGFGLPDHGKPIYQSTDQPVNLSTLLWCCKEAVFKWYGYGEIDFKKHINIKQINPEEKIVECEFRKTDPLHFAIKYLFFDQLCMAFVIS